MLESTQGLIVAQYTNNAKVDTVTKESIWVHCLLSWNLAYVVFKRDVKSVSGATDGRLCRAGTECGIDDAKPQGKGGETRTGEYQ